jgi:hypothetical protein
MKGFLGFLKYPANTNGFLRSSVFRFYTAYASAANPNGETSYLTLFENPWQPMIGLRSGFVFDHLFIAVDNETRFAPH